MASATDHFGLSDKTLNALTAIFAAHQGVDKVLIYGSRAKGNYREGSDIDLTIDSECLSFEQLIRLKGQIDDSMIPQMVDLSVLQSIQNPELLNHIMRVGKVFYERQGA